jgi:hypothetical protein
VTTRQSRIRAEVTARAKPLEQALARWLTAYGRVLAAQEAKRLGAAIKASTDEERLRDELRTLLLRFGLRQATASAQGAARSVGQDIIIPGTLLSDAIAGKPTRIKWFWEYRNGVHQRVTDIMETTRDEVRASVRRIVQDAAAEDREPSMGEVARRIHTQFHGVEAHVLARARGDHRADGDGAGGEHGDLRGVQGVGCERDRVASAAGVGAAWVAEREAGEGGGVFRGVER